MPRMNAIVPPLTPGMTSALPMQNPLVTITAGLSFFCGFIGCSGLPLIGRGFYQHREDPATGPALHRFTGGELNILTRSHEDTEDYENTSDFIF